MVKLFMDENKKEIIDNLYDLVDALVYCDFINVHSGYLLKNKIKPKDIVIYMKEEYNKDIDFNYEMFGDYYEFFAK